MFTWIVFLVLALGVAAFLAFGGPALGSASTAQVAFYALALLLVLSLVTAVFGRDDSSRRPKGPRG